MRIVIFYRVFRYGRGCIVIFWIGLSGCRFGFDGGRVGSCCSSNDSSSILCNFCDGFLDLFW